MTSPPRSENNVRRIIAYFYQSKDSFPSKSGPAAEKLRGRALLYKFNAKANKQKNGRRMSAVLLNIFG